MSWTVGAAIAYADFRTGLSFREVFRMLWSASPDPADWRHKRRATVLGLWRQLKLEMYDQYLGRLVGRRRRRGARARRPLTCTEVRKVVQSWQRARGLRGGPGRRRPARHRRRRR